MIYNVALNLRILIYLQLQVFFLLSFLRENLFLLRCDLSFQQFWRHFKQNTPSVTKIDHFFHLSSVEIFS